MPIVKALLTEQRYSMQLAWKVFLPWCIYFVTCLIYLSNYSANFSESNEGKFFSEGWIPRVIMIAGICLFSSIEIL